MAEEADMDVDTRDWMKAMAWRFELERAKANARAELGGNGYTER